MSGARDGGAPPNAPQPASAAADRARDRAWALVVGASATVGEQFARQLGDRGLNVALVARRKDRLDVVAAEIHAKSGVETRVIALDLGDVDATDRLLEATADLEVDFLVLNANVHRVGDFDLMSVDDKRTMVRMNLEMPIVLAHHYGADMVERRRGTILTLNEVNCFSPLAFDAVFQGTKAGLRIFSESLWLEYRKANVRVGSVHLSGIEGSESFDAKISSGRRRFTKRIGVAMAPSEIVAQSLEQLDRGRLLLVPDTWTYLNVYTLKFTDLLRLIGGKLSRIVPSAFFRWFMDGEGSRASQRPRR